MRAFSVVLLIWNIISVFTTGWQFYQHEISWQLLLIGELINTMFIVTTAQIILYARINRVIIICTPILLVWYVYYIFQDLAQLNNYTGWREFLQVWFVMIDASSIVFLFVMLNIIYIHVYNFFADPVIFKYIKNVGNNILSFCQRTGKVFGLS